MKTPLEFSRLRTPEGENVARLVSDFRVKMDTYDLSNPPRYHADHRLLLLVSQEFANTLAALECAEKLMAHNWDGKAKFKLPDVVRLLSKEYAVALASRTAPDAPPRQVFLADLIPADDWSPSRFMTPEARFAPKVTEQLGANYYAVGPVYAEGGRKPRPYAMGYTTRAVVVEGLELGDVWPIVLPPRTDG